MTDVTCRTVGTALPTVTMTSTFKRANSAAISAWRSARPSDQRYSIATLRFSTQLSSRRCATKAVVHGLKADASAPRKPIVGSLPACCACAASGHAVDNPVIPAMKSRRRITLPRPLFDDLVGEREELGRKLDAERLRGLEIDHQLELGRLLHRQLGRLGALEHHHRRPAPGRRHGGQGAEVDA